MRQYGPRSSRRPGTPLCVRTIGRRQIAVIGRSACYLYPSAKLWQKHMDEGKPEPEVLSFA